MKYLFLFVTLMVIGFSAWVSAPMFGYPLNGLSQADVSDMHPTAITPEPFTFGIWSVIYLSWIIMGLAFVGVPFFRRLLDRAIVSKNILVVYMLTIAVTAIWLVPWAYLWIDMALLILIGLLFLVWHLFGLVRGIGGYLRHAVELFMGWIHIATFANFIYWLHFRGFVSSGNELIAGMGVLTIALFATIFFQIRYRTYIVSMVYLWASLGIWVAHDVLIQRWIVVIYASVVILSMFYRNGKLLELEKK